MRNHVSRALAGLDGPQLETATDIFHDLVTPSGVKVAHTAEDLAQMTAHSRDTVASVLGRLYEERILRAVDPAPGTTQARYEIFHDRLAAPILEWRDQQENARLERARQRAEIEAQTQREQARRFKRLARIMLGLVVSLLVLLVAVVVLLRYARDQSARASRAKHAALSDKADATYFGLTTRAQSQLSGRPDISLLLYLAAYGERPQPVAERSLVATLQAVKRSGAIGILHGHTDAVDSIAFSPVGTTLASASADKTIRLWTVTGRGHYPLGHPLRAPGPLFSVAFDPSGQILASGSFNEIILWNIARHAEQGTIGYDSGAVTSIAFSPRGKILAAGGADGTVLLLNLLTHRRTLLAVPSGTSVRSVAFSPQGDVLAATSDRAIALFNVVTGAQLGQPLSGTTGVVYSLAFGPHGETLAAGGNSGTIDVWDLARPSQPPLALRGLQKVFSIAFSPYGQALAAAGRSRTALWHLGGQRRPAESLTGHQGGVTSVAFSSDGRILASAGADRTISLWESRVGAQFGRPIVRRKQGATLVAISPDGHGIASAGPDGQIDVSDRNSGTLERVLPAAGGPVSHLAFDPGGRVLAASYLDGRIRLWDVAAARQLGAPLQAHTGPVYSIAFDHTGARLVSGGVNGTVRLWDVRAHRMLGRPLTGDFGTVYAVAFSPDGATVAAGGDGRAIRLWSARTQLPLAPPLIAQGNTVFTLAYSPDGRRLASGGADDTIRIWKIDAPPYVAVHTLTGDSNYIRSVAFSPDGQTLASGSTDTTVRLWDVATGTELGSPLAGHTQSVETVAFSSDGKLLASGSLDNTVRLWQAIKLPSSFAQVRAEVCRFLGAGLSRAEWNQYAPDIPYKRTCPRDTPS